MKVGEQRIRQHYSKYKVMVKNVLFKISKVYLIVFVVVVVLTLVRTLPIFSGINLTFFNYLSYLFILFFHPVLIFIAIAIYWWTKSPEKLADSEKTEKSTAVWMLVCTVSGFILVCALIFTAFLIIGSRSTSGGGEGTFISLFIVPIGLIVLPIFVHSLLEVRHRTKSQVSPNQSGTLSIDRPQMAEMKAAVAKFKNDMPIGNRRPVGMNTFTQLIIAASAVLVVGGIIVLTVISSFGETTDGKNWFAKFSQPESSTGAPGTGANNEKLKFSASQFTDEQLAETMKMVQDLVVQYHRKTGRLPSMTGDLTLVTQSIPFEYPASGNQEPTIDGVHYEWRGGDLFDLCANFTGSNKGTLTGEEVVWEHAAGKVCLRRDIRKIFLQPVPPKVNPPSAVRVAPESAVDIDSLQSFWKNYSICQPTSFRHGQQEQEDDDFFSRLFGMTAERAYWMRVIGTDPADDSHCLVAMGYEISEKEIVKMSGEAECRIDKTELRGMDTLPGQLALFDQNGIINNKLTLDIADGIVDGSLGTVAFSQKEKDEIMDIGTRYAAQAPPRLLTFQRGFYCVSKD